MRCFYCQELEDKIRGCYISCNDKEHNGGTLFEKHEDKIRYLNKMREYQKQYGFKVYAYCLMTNHGHFIIDSNGADISKIMQGQNLSYAINFNKINKKKGTFISRQI